MRAAFVLLSACLAATVAAATAPAEAPARSPAGSRERAPARSPTTAPVKAPVEAPAAAPSMAPATAPVPRARVTDAPATCVAALVAPAPQPGDSQPNAKSLITEREALPLQAVSWELEARGTMVDDTLEARFAPVASARHVVLAVRPSVALKVLDVEVSADGRLLESWPASLPGEGAAAPRGRKPAVPGQAWSLVAPEGAALTARFRVETEAGFRAGVFSLALDPVSGRCGTDEGFPAELAVRLTVDHEGELELAGEPSHPFSIEPRAGSSVLSLSDGAAPAGERPVRVAWKLASEDEPAAGAWSWPSRGGEGSEVAVVVTAPEAPDAALVRSKDVVFVVDVSGSMARDAKIDRAREAVAACVDALHEGDAFNIVAFSDTATSLANVAASGAVHRAAATSFLAGLAPKGGTLLAPALDMALTQRREDAGHRLIVVLSDGILGDERDVLGLLDAKLGDARLLVVAIGSDARLDTLQRLAEKGRGEAAVAAGAGEIVAAMTSLMGSFSSPLAWDIAIDWDGATPVSMKPERIPDLYAGRPVTLRAVFAGDAPARARITGATVAGPGTLDLTVPVASK